VATPADLQRLLNIDAEQWNLLMRQRLLNRAEALTEIAEEELDQADSEAEAVLNGAEAETVQSLLKGMDPRQREVVQQVVLSGLSYRQIARRMQVSPMTVQRLLHRGLEQLRGHLEVADFRSPERVDPGRSAARVC